jgi:hypothetical protein
MKIIRRFDAPDLKRWLESALNSNGMSVADICSRCGFTSTYWYSLLKEDGAKSIAGETLEKIEDALQQYYEDREKNND